MPKKTDISTTWVISANDLRQGNVIYLTGNDGWVADINHAQQLSDKATAEERLPAATVQQLQVIDPYLVEVEQHADGTVSPVHFREQFRVSGPTHQQAGKTSDRLTKAA